MGTLFIASTGGDPSLINGRIEATRAPDGKIDFILTTPVATRFITLEDIEGFQQFGFIIAWAPGGQEWLKTLSQSNCYSTNIPSQLSSDYIPDISHDVLGIEKITSGMIVPGTLPCGKPRRNVAVIITVGIALVITSLIFSVGWVMVGNIDWGGSSVIDPIKKEGGPLTVENASLWPPELASEDTTGTVGRLFVVLRHGEKGGVSANIVNELVNNQELNFSADESAFSRSRIKSQSAGLRNIPFDYKFSSLEDPFNSTEVDIKTPSDSGIEVRNLRIILRTMEPYARDMGVLFDANEITKNIKWSESENDILVTQNLCITHKATQTTNVVFFYETPSGEIHVNKTYSVKYGLIFIYIDIMSYSETDNP